jgi:hypothetical protein
LKKLLARLVRVSPAMVVAMLALLVALGGVSTAANKISNPSSPQASDKKKKKVLRGPRGKRGLRGLRGPVGPIGPIGPQGPVGPAGAPNPNADKLNGYAANGLTRTARGVGPAFPSSVALAGCGVSETQVAAVTINAPAAGFVYVTGSVTTRHLGAGDTVRSHLLATGGEASSFIYNVAGNQAGHVLLAPLSNTWVFPVGAGAITIQLRACSFAAGADAFGGQLAAVYSPFGSSGAGTLGAKAGTGVSQANPSSE